MKMRILPIFLLSLMTLMLTRCAEDKAIEESPTVVDENMEKETEPVEPQEVEEPQETEDPHTKKKPAKVKKTDKKSRKPLTLVVKNMRSADAPVMVGMYDSKGSFPKESGSLKEYTFIPTSTTLTAQITDQEYGQYAFAIYQDENSNGKIDKNFLGIPKEGYCFSNNYRPKLRAPNFQDCKFEYDEKTNTVTATMIW